MRARYLTALLPLAVLLTAGAASAAAQKTTLCHVPPDDPSNAHEIVVSEKAIEAHLGNHPGDQVGICPPQGCDSAGDCTDGNACTIDVCNSDGSCDFSQPVDCSDGDVCTVDTCFPDSGCANPPEPDDLQIMCDDLNACSGPDMCVAGSCAGDPIADCCVSDTDCPTDDACTVHFCDADNTCNQVDLSAQCTAGACEVAFCNPVDGCTTAPVSCPDDGDICTVSECNPNICGAAGGCETFPNPNPPEPGFEVTCDDGLDNDCDGAVDSADPDCQGCTTNDECAPFVCFSGNCLTSCLTDADCVANFFCSALDECVPLDSGPEPCEYGGIACTDPAETCVVAELLPFSETDLCFEVDPGTDCVVEGTLCGGKSVCLVVGDQDPACIEVCRDDVAPIGTLGHPDCSGPTSTCVGLSGRDDLGACL